LGAGREADVYAYGDGAVLKLYRPGFDGHRAEAATLRALDGRAVAPKLLGVIESDGRTGVVVERVAGPDLLTLLQRRPWHILAVARSLATTHLAVHRVQAPTELADLRVVLTDRIRGAGLPPQLRDFARRVLDGLPDGDRLCHGDYHPGNLLLAHGQPVVIDWGSATRGLPEADHARTLLLLRSADPLPGTPPLSRALIAAGRSLLANGYARTYRRGSPPMTQTGSWLVVHAAARVSEGIHTERDMLIDRLEHARLESFRR
jgi:aminoglycoside phosphotransferase (APT) family kinase protein